MTWSYDQQRVTQQTATIQQNATMTATETTPWDQARMTTYRRAARGDRGRRLTTCTGCAHWSDDVLVTAPQMQPRTESIERLPWGQHHLKANGAGLTLCGQSALTWHVFWNYRTDPCDPRACPECLDALKSHH